MVGGPTPIASMIRASSNLRYHQPVGHDLQTPNTPGSSVRLYPVIVRQPDQFVTEKEQPQRSARAVRAASHDNTAFRSSWNIRRSPEIRHMWRIETSR
jgi:hypothetical protein